jgi:hypothetical protein
MSIGIRPSTIRKLRQKKLSRVSPLHISIARLSYMKDQQQQFKTIEGQQKDTFYRIIKRC